MQRVVFIKGVEYRICYLNKLKKYIVIHWPKYEGGGQSKSDFSWQRVGVGKLETHVFAWTNSLWSPVSNLLSLTDNSIYKFQSLFLRFWPLACFVFNLRFYFRFLCMWIKDRKSLTFPQWKLVPHLRWRNLRPILFHDSKCQ